MRPLEITLLSLLLVTILAVLFWRRAPRGLVALPLAALAVAGLQLLLEGYRWQMVPAFGLALVLAVLGALTWLAPVPALARPAGGPPHPRPVPAGRRRLPPSLAGCLLIVLPGLWLVALLPPLLFPVPRLPAPGGPFAIGTVTFQWLDAARPEAYTPDPADARELMVQVWYPAAAVPAGAQPAPWVSRLDLVGPAIARYLGLPPFFLDHAALVSTHAYADVPAASAAGPFPVVLYSHGWNGFRTVNLDQLEALASRGYVVAAVDHTYGAMVAVFADGRVALNNPAALPEADVVGEAAYQQAITQLERTYAADLVFVLDQLAQVQAGRLPSPLAGALDLERMGLFGHSTGGGAALIACAEDPRCDAGFGQDAWLVPVPASVLAAGLDRPFAFARSERWATAENDARLERLVTQGLRGPAYRLTTAGTRHNDFTLLPLLTPLAPVLKLKGPLAAERVMELNRAYLVAFFDTYLKDQPSPLLAGPAFPEVTFEAWRR